MVTGVRRDELLAFRRPDIARPPRSPAARGGPGFEQTVTSQGFDFTANPKLPVAQIRDLAALRWLQAGSQ